MLKQRGGIGSIGGMGGLGGVSGVGGMKQVMGAGPGRYCAGEGKSDIIDKPRRLESKQID